MAESDAEAKRLEALWSGDFGDDYVDRNLGAYDARAPFWTSIVERTTPSRVLEVGCNVGGNLRFIAPELEPGHAYGIDINRKALTKIHEFVPDVNALLESARDLPFRDGWFDLVFSMGVLIHQPEESLPEVIREMARVSSKYLLAGEYFAAETTEVPYRGHEGALFRRDYEAEFRKAVPGLTTVETGHLTADEGFDDITWWLFEKN
jgi:spore coat polysaccharide biosynthesis protein SpsF